MPEAVSTYANYVSTPNPNTQPIYPKIPLDWRCQVAGEVIGKNPVHPNFPVLLGRASEAGALIECMILTPLYEASDDGFPSDFQVHFYSKRFGDDRYWFVGPVTMNGNTRFVAGGEVGLNPLLPAPQRGWRLSPYEELYVALSRTVPLPGINVFAFGGHYS